MSNKLQKNSDLRGKIERFLEQSRDAACRTHEQAGNAMRKMFIGENASRMVRGVIFDVSFELDQAAQLIVGTIRKNTDTKICGERKFLDDLWKMAARFSSSSTSPKEAAIKYLAGIDVEAEKIKRYVIENKLVFLDGGIDEFVIGPIRIVRGEKIVGNLQNIFDGGQNWHAEIGTPGLNMEAGKNTIKVSSCNWDMEINAASENIAEESAWLAGLVVSLLRLATKDTLGPFVVNTDKPEPHPFKGCVSENTAIIFDGDGIQTGGQWVPTRYFITAATIDYCKRDEFKKIVDYIFNPKKNSLGQRLAQGLGWLARARQSEDRAEQFLYFFTAIEALLSNSDKTAPVVQNIARHVATILGNDHQKRAANAKIIRDLYALRSSLVHTGSRNVSNQDLRNIKYISEYIFFRVLDKVDLSESHDTFHNGLLECSYGLPWGDDTIHYLSSAHVDMVVSPD